MAGNKDITTITKSMRYEIVKPVDCTWEEFGKVINGLRYKCARMANKSIQMFWDWNNYKFTYKKEHGTYPEKSEEPNFYKLLRADYPDVGTQVVSQVLQYVKIKFMKDLKDIVSLKKGIPFYKDNMPICVHNQAYILRRMDDYEISCRLLPEDAPQYWFTFIIKKGSRGQQSILEKINSNDYKKGMLQIVRDNHKKWYAVISFTFSPAEKKLPEGIMEVIVSDESIKMSKGTWINEMPIIHQKQALATIEKRLEELRLQKRWRGQGRIGHGRKAIFAPMQKCEEKKANFKATANHNWSRIIVNTAIRMNCDVIHLTGEITDWTNFDLKSKVTYKATENGIKVI